MSDDADRASDLAERERGAALHRMTAAAKAAVDLTACVVCGEDIPSTRRAAVPTAIRCTGCQADQERRVA